MDGKLPVSGALADYFRSASTERIIERLTNGTLNADAQDLAAAELETRGLHVSAFHAPEAAGHAGASSDDRHASREFAEAALPLPFPGDVLDKAKPDLPLEPGESDAPRWLPWLIVIGCVLAVVGYLSSRLF